MENEEIKKTQQEELTPEEKEILSAKCWKPYVDLYRKEGMTDKQIARSLLDW